jgi:uracil-DNA glycosylase family 4
VTVPLDLELVRSEVVVCTRCRLSQTRTLAVPGEGSSSARVLFVGEGPGGRENERGRPFIGPAGQFLSELLRGIGWDRSQVFITNIVKCWPPGNRDPLPDEKSACNGYLDRQVFALQPAVIATLGRHSMEKFFGPGRSISRIHGTTTRWRGVLCYALYHPAAALHQPGLKSVLMQDFARLPALVAAEEAALAQELSHADERTEVGSVTDESIGGPDWNDAQPKLF